MSHYHCTSRAEGPAQRERESDIGRLRWENGQGGSGVGIREAFMQGLFLKGRGVKQREHKGGSLLSPPVGPSDWL